ncbi:hypothetical protein VCR31J2_1310835 [Vibrio coralliirubri]|uniref:Uncharacterized protein n=1 Tax=Vibrio coralliirubri TaxID=1516159 RepID=A0AA86X017_9VIBR|nr:hypothetical protein VCR31J2_1310835 [Vibrio coralliirubri]
MTEKKRTPIQGQRVPAKIKLERNNFNLGLVSGTRIKGDETTRFINKLLGYESIAALIN